LRQEKRSFEMNVQKLVELRFGRVHEGRMDADPGVIDQKIEIVPLPRFVQRILHLFRKGGERFVVGNIKLKRDCFAANFFNPGNHRIGFGFPAMVGQDNVMPFFSKMKGHAFAKATASTGYDGVFHYRESTVQGRLSQQESPTPIGLKARC
jgi:hypothetical protein